MPNPLNITVLIDVGQFHVQELLKSKTMETKHFLLLVVILVVAALLGTRYVLPQRSDLEPREPPTVRSRMPFFGHAIGLLRQGHFYLPSLV